MKKFIVFAALVGSLLLPQKSYSGCCWGNIQVSSCSSISGQYIQVGVVCSKTAGGSCQGQYWNFCYGYAYNINCQGYVFNSVLSVAC